MKLDRDFLTSPTGQVLLVGAVLFLGVLAIRWQHRGATTQPMPTAKPAPSVPLPKTLTREVAKFTKPGAPMSPISTVAGTSAPNAAPTPRETPLALFTAPREAAPAPTPLRAPFGRLIPCETVVALESNRLDTPIIGLVTEDVWHDGQLIIPAGAEVHGKAALDRARERLASQSSWRIVWRTPDRDNGTELPIQGIALDRECDPATGDFGEHDGSAGLRGHVVKTEDDRELKLFAATFLATATSALQDVRSTTGLLGESSVPVATARNAVLAGTGAVLREYAQGIREAISRDGFYLRVPAGKAFYLYVTQAIDRSPLARVVTANHP